MSPHGHMSQLGSTALSMIAAICSASSGGGSVAPPSSAACWLRGDGLKAAGLKLAGLKAGGDGLTVYSDAELRSDEVLAALAAAETGAEGCA